MGLLQGLSEFLPISSSGHLFLMDALLGQEGMGQRLSFVLLLHFATFLSVLLVFFKSLNQFFLGLFRGEGRLLGLKVLCSLLPLFLVGVFCRSFVAESFEKNTVALGFFSTAVLLFSLLFVPRIFPQRQNKRQDKRQNKRPALSLDEMSFPQAFFIGLGQALAVLPGFSRSGWTISIGLYCGLSPRASVYYSFLISLPAIFGSALVEFFLQAREGNLLMKSVNDVLATGGATGGEGFLGPLLAFLMAFISGSLSLLLLLKLASSQKLFIFSFYLIPLSLLVFFLL